MEYDALISLQKQRGMMLETRFVKIISSLVRVVQCAQPLIFSHIQDCEDHSLLLCSLLLGFGLDAYVCVGTKGRGTAHTWVATVSSEGLITFWESLTGHR